MLDALACLGAVLAGLALRFGGDTTADAPQLLGLCALAAAWVIILALDRAYDSRCLGVGAEEFGRVWRSFIYFTAAVAVGSYLTKAELARGFFLVAMPLTVVLTTLGRYGARRFLHHIRRNGGALTRVVALGDARHSAALAKEMERDAYGGLKVVGACLTTSPSAGGAVCKELAELGIPVVGDLDHLVSVVQRLDADAIAVTASHGLDAQTLRWISWQLEGTGIDLLVAPGLIEVTGRRLHVRPLSFVPLLQLEAPRFSGFARLVKGVVDRVTAAAALLLLAPLLVALASLCGSPPRGRRCSARPG